MGDSMDGTRWLSYAELAQARGISKASATRLVFRKGWRRRVGNDGIARAAVPLTETARHVHDNTPDTIPGNTATVQGQTAELIALQATLDVRARELVDEITHRARSEGELVGLREALRIAEAATRDATERAKRAEDAAHTATQRAEHAEASAVEAWRTAADLARRLAPAQPTSPALPAANPVALRRSWLRRLLG